MSRGLALSYSFISSCSTLVSASAVGWKRTHPARLIGRHDENVRKPAGGSARGSTESKGTKDPAPENPRDSALNPRGFLVLGSRPLAAGERRPARCAERFRPGLLIRAVPSGEACSVRSVEVAALVASLVAVGIAFGSLILAMRADRRAYRSSE